MHYLEWIAENYFYSRDQISEPVPNKVHGLAYISQISRARARVDLGNMSRFKDIFFNIALVYPRAPDLCLCECVHQHLIARDWLTQVCLISFDYMERKCCLLLYNSHTFIYFLRFKY